MLDLKWDHVSKRGHRYICLGSMLAQFSKQTGCSDLYDYCKQILHFLNWRCISDIILFRDMIYTDVFNPDHDVASITIDILIFFKTHKRGWFATYTTNMVCRCMDASVETRIFNGQYNYFPSIFNDRDCNICNIIYIDCFWLSLHTLAANVMKSPIRWLYEFIFRHDFIKIMFTGQYFYICRQQINVGKCSANANCVIKSMARGWEGVESCQQSTAP